MGDSMRKRRLAQLRPYPIASLRVLVIEFEYAPARIPRRLVFKLDESPAQIVFLRLVVLGPGRSLQEQIARVCAAQQLRDTAIQRRGLCEAIPY